jgi:hypothetical protein
MQCSLKQYCGHYHGCIFTSPDIDTGYVIRVRSMRCPMPAELILDHLKEEEF